MLSIFRTNQVFAAVVLLGYVCLVRLGVFFKLPEIGSVGEPAFFSELVFTAIGSNQKLATALAAALVFVQAILVNRMANNFRISNETSYFPAVFYVLAASALPDFLGLSEPLMAMTFVLFSIGELLGTYNVQREIAGRIFNIGFWLGIGSLFYPPVLWFVFAVFIGLNLLRGFDLKELIMVFSGLFVPFLLSFTWFFWQNAGGWFWEKHFASRQFGLCNPFDPHTTRPEFLAKIALFGLLIALVLLGYATFYRKKLIQMQKYVSIFYWFLVIGCASVLLRPGFQFSHFLLAAPPLGTFLGIQFLSIKKQPIAEILHLTLLAVVLFLQFKTW